VGEEDVAEPCPDVVHGCDEAVLRGVEAAEGGFEAWVDEDGGQNADVVAG